MSPTAFSRSTLACLFLGILAQSSGVLGQNATDPDIPMGFIPNKTYAIIAGCFYVFTAGLCIIWSMRHWGRYMLTIIVAALFYALGLFLRVVVANDPTSVTKYALMNLISILSPCGFIAVVYMLLGRLAIHLNAEEYLLIKPRFLTRVFVTSDVVTFLVQGSGGGLIASDDPSKSKIGDKVFLGGLIAQLVSFIVYTCLFAVFIFRLWSNRRDQWSYRPDGIFKHWLVLVAAMAISCQNIIIRSVFRVVENAQGFHGYLATHEVYFYFLDCVVLWIAITVFIVAWPPMYLTGYKSGSKESRSTETTHNDSRA